MKPYVKKPLRVIITCLSIVIGNALMGFIVAAFIIPHDIIMGGTTGIGIVLNKWIPSLDVSLFILILNVVLLFIGLFVLGKKLFWTTVASSILYPGFLALFQRIPGIEHLTDDPLLAAIFAGSLLGLALGLVMKVGSSTGGMDIVDLILSKWTHLPVSYYVIATDIVIIGLQAVFSPAEGTLLGIVVIVLETLILDRTMILGKSQIQLTVVSRAYDRIREALLNDLEAGVTMVFIETGRLREKGKAVLSVIPERKLYQAEELIHEIDPEAFIAIAKVNEVRGRGFTMERANLAEPEPDFSEGDPVVAADRQSE